jgi:hypothetical protein
MFETKAKAFLRQSAQRSSSNRSNAVTSFVFDMAKYVTLATSTRTVPKGDSFYTARAVHSLTIKAVSEAATAVTIL